ncbi:MAG: insulinase family protein, partial [Desulfobacteraceae bacterium]|nr:insulinase family protein [Desulfobacteraceae bacterium]
FGQVEHQGIEPFYHHESEAGNTSVTIETVDEKPLPADSVEYQRRRLLAEMANQIVQHRIDALLNREDTPFSEAGISSGHYLRFVKAAEITADCAPENWESALGAIEKTLRQALEHGFTASEVKRVQKEYTNRLKQAVKGASTRKSGDISRQILSSLNRDRVFQSPQQRQDLLQTAVDAATPASLQQTLKNEWAAHHRLLLVTGNADLSDGEAKPKQQIKNAYEQSRKKPVEKPEESGQVSFPYLSAPENPGEIQSRQDIEDLGITRVVFENGVTLMVKPTDFQDNQVLTAVSFGRGESAEPADFPALAEMAEKVINQSGLGQLNREELDQTLAGKNTSVSFDVEADKFVLSANSVPDETSLMFELLYTYLLDPGFRQTAYARAVEQYRQRHKSLIHSVHGALVLEGSRFLAGGDSRFGLPSLDAVEKTDLADIRKWVKPAFDKAPVEIAIVGDVQPDQVIDAAATFFGSLPERKAQNPSEQRENPDFPEGEKRDISVSTRISKGLVMVAYPSTDIWDIHKTRRLSVLSDIFSDRMRIRIREEMGASYSQAAYNQPSRAYPDYGIFAGYAIIDPDEAERVETAIREISGKLHEKGATKDELKRAIEPTLTGIRKQLKTNKYWLDTVLKGAARHPEQLDWSRSIKSDYAGITVEEINRLARKYLENARAATLWIRPEKTDAEVPKPEPGKTPDKKKSP